MKTLFSQPIIDRSEEKNKVIQKGLSKKREASAPFIEPIDLNVLQNIKNMQIPAFVPRFLLTAYLKTQISQLETEIERTSFSWWQNRDGNQILYETATGLLWYADDDGTEYTSDERIKRAAAARIGGVSGWRLPIANEILALTKIVENEMMVGVKCWLQEGFSTLYRLKVHDWSKELFEHQVSSNDFCRQLYVHEGAHNSTSSLIRMMLTHGWTLLGNGEENSGESKFFLSKFDVKELLTDLDYTICRQPRLEKALFTDPNKGLWEAWGLPEAEQSQLDIRARDPQRDVREDFVAIDFGTSSTVVAWDDNGRSKLMRVGVKDFWAKEQPGDYENPTVLEFIDFPAMLSAWQSTAYRPGVLWDQVRCSHEALHNWRNNESNPQVVGSILGKIKQWAMRQDKDYRLRVTDQENGFEHEFLPLAPRNPVKGKPLAVSNDDPFDPVELYAWFLGMNINWRQRGLFLKYYMSFPVDYPQSVKDNILAAFRRGLQRSLPETLIHQGDFRDFSVEERASEPAAYAAIALPTLDIKPGADCGEGYAVFDFGGGTADFDFGFYRQASPEEEDEGWEVVFERCGTAGDKFLGGENLLENLAYQTFYHNLELCREKKIAFTRPLDAEDFAGSEMFLEKTRAATTNTLMLMTRLRPLWENGALPDEGSGATKIDLLTREGNKVPCELALPCDTLLKYLEHRIEKGVQKFFAALHKAFGEDLPKSVHVLLAGNASRSKMVIDLFGLLPPNAKNKANSPAFARTQNFLETLFGERLPTIIPYPPLAPDAQNLYGPTGKTGVALGLLKLCPGSVIKTIDHARQSAGNEAPFAYYIGRIRLGKFQPCLRQGVPYGEWHELGVPRERVFNLYYTESPLANTDTLKEGDMELNKRILSLAGDTPGHKLFTRAIKPGQIEICTSISKEDALQERYEYFKSIDLTEKS